MFPGFEGKGELHIILKANSLLRNQKGWDRGRWVGVTCWVNSTWLCFALDCGKPSLSTRWTISLILGVNGIMKQPSQCLFISLSGLALPKREIYNEWEWLRL